MSMMCGDDVASINSANNNTKGKFVIKFLYIFHHHDVKTFFLNTSP